jgi:LPS-assembly lipoprotein
MWFTDNRARRRAAVLMARRRAAVLMARRRAAVLMVVAPCVLLAAGCGFRPLYGQSGGGDAATLATVEIEPIPDRIGQKMRTLLRERLSPKGPSDRSLFRLSVSLTEARQELAFRKDESATRANLTVTANFRLAVIDRPDIGTLSGTAYSTNSYNVLESQFATLSAANDARDRALVSLAEEIRLRIAAGMRNPRLFVPPEPDRPG